MSTPEATEKRPTAPDADEARPSRRMLLFRLKRYEYALPLSAVDGLGELGRVRPVPGAPPGVLGLTEWRGRILSVLDLPLLLDDSPLEERPCLVRLAAPLDHCGLHVPASIRVERVETDAEREANDTAAAEKERNAPRVIDPRRLLDGLRAGGHA